MKKIKHNFSYTLSPKRRRELDAEIKRIGADQVFTNAVDAMLGNEKTTQYWTQDKNSYAFWGPTSATLVKTPDSVYFPISFDAFCVSGTKNEFHLKSHAARNANAELITTATQIADWAQAENLNAFFIKNANFSGKHFWPFTCNIDFTPTPNMTRDDKIAKIYSHICNINSIAMEIGINPGLGILARKKLDLDPFFYAFGTKFYILSDPMTGETMTFDTNGETDIDKCIRDIQNKKPYINIQSYHIGMPITRELRVFSINGMVAGFIPYWSPIAFDNISVYNIKDHMPFTTALRQMNTFSDNELNYVGAQTNRLIQHPKFHDTDWAIDWIVTRDNQWYMTDMQMARDSYMDFNNMKFTSDSAHTETVKFMNSQLERIIRARKNQHPLQKLRNKLSGAESKTDDILATFGYPSADQIRKMHTAALQSKSR